MVSSEPAPRDARELVGRRMTVETPATSANLGAGFDALALALELVNTTTVEVIDRPTVELSVEGEGAESLKGKRRNRFVVALDRGLREAGLDPGPLGYRVSMSNAIPMFRGLGSSATATVAGLTAADALAGGRLGDATRIRLAAEMEGHPDNGAAAILGGFVVVVAQTGGRYATVSFPPPPSLRCVLFIPDRPLPTREMRAALPAQVPHADAAFNVGRAALAVAAFATGGLSLLGAATEDRLHERYRARVFPELPILVRAARDAGALGACLSGAGSAVIAFTEGDPAAAEVAAAFQQAATRAGLAGNARVLMPRGTGATVRDG